MWSRSDCAAQCGPHDKCYARGRGSRLHTHTQCTQHTMVFNKGVNHFHFIPHDSQSQCYIISTSNLNLCCYWPMRRRSWPPLTNQRPASRNIAVISSRDNAFHSASQSRPRWPSEEYRYAASLTSIFLWFGKYFNEADNLIFPGLRSISPEAAAGMGRCQELDSRQVVCPQVV